MSESLFFAMLGAVIGFTIFYFNLSAKKSIIFAVMIAAFAGILYKYIL